MTFHLSKKSTESTMFCFFKTSCLLSLFGNLGICYV